MSDLTRDQAIAWCKENKCDFVKPIFPPPSGWGWYEQSGEDHEYLILAAVFTLNYGEITRKDLGL